MSLTWDGNAAPITASSGGKLLTSHGPALVAAQTLLQMVYVGRGGRNLWSATTLAASFPQWDLNAQVDGGATASGGALLSAFRPALALFNGNIHMVYASESGEDLYWAWSKPYGQWENVKLPWSSSQDLQPTVVAHSDGKLYLAWHEFIASSSQNDPEHNYIYYSCLDGREPLEVDSWAEATLVADGAQLPCLASFNNKLRIFATPADAGANKPADDSVIIVSEFIGGVFEPFSNFKITGQSPRSVGGVAAAVFNNSLYIVYPGSGSTAFGGVRNIWYAWIDPSDVTHGNIQVKTPHGDPHTSAPIGLAEFDGLLCLAYKGNASDNVFVSYGKA